ncbi:hypothetical protein RJ639_015346 [Escallonia herrerae]|uniref:Very-long-chain (3R)-3-hydroxyacyl-CoA dehydratase n=1 Tax=Escallonia herrerae TaxID=1293975 RepID=A0AA89AM52_9ASTE|nr:hypothetical protein RJ639_015346 [Escallonia herrerae]
MAEAAAVTTPTPLAATSSSSSSSFKGRETPAARIPPILTLTDARAPGTTEHIPRRHDLLERGLLQAVAFLEVIHGAIGVVPGGMLLPLMQWGGRTHFLFAIVRRIHEVLTSVTIPFVIALHLTILGNTAMKAI